jgi:hypothetical protein
LKQKRQKEGRVSRFTAGILAHVTAITRNRLKGTTRRVEVGPGLTSRAAMEIPMTCRSALLLLLIAVPLGAPAVSADSSDALGDGRVVIVPLNLGVRASTEVEPGVDPVWSEILAHFAARQKPATALERKSAGALWSEVMAEVRAKPGGDVYEAYAIFARRIADQVDYSAIVFPSLVTRAARIQGKTAAWDGVRRQLDLTGPETVGTVMGSDLIVSSTGVRGEIAAASLHVAVLSANGELRFEGAGGLSLLQELDEENEKAKGSNQVAVEMRQDAFADSSELREGIEVAFRRPLPASRAH